MRLLLAYSLLISVHGARILSVYPIPAYSHQIVHRALTQELARRANNLVVITTDPYLPKLRPIDNITEIDLHDLSNGIWKRGMSNISLKRKSSVEDFHNIILKTATEVFDAQLSTTDLRRLVQNNDESFDLVIVTCVFRPAFFYTHKFKAPVIGFSSSVGLQYNYDSTGTPSHPMLYADMFDKKIAKLTMLDKFDAVYIDLWQRFAYWYSADEENRIGRKHFGEDTPDVRQLVHNMDVMFLNVNPVWDGVRPAPPAVVYVDGLHIKPVKELPEELKSYLDNCTRGVVYMSLGSKINSAELPADRLQIFLRVFRELDYCVLWKWEADQLPGRPDNVRLAKWLPQADLLRHPNIRVFITQCGLQSTDEAIEAQVPLVGVPFVVDQETNAQKYILHGIGVALDIKTLSVELLRQAILEVAENERYRSSMVRLKRLMRDQPMGPLERAAWWAEYVVRHGGARHLRSPGAAASLVDLWALDVVFALVTATLVTGYLLVCTLRQLFALLGSSYGRSMARRATDEAAGKPSVVGRVRSLFMDLWNFQYI